MYKKMLVLLDGSKLAEVVFSYALALSIRLDLELELLHVCTPQEANELPMREAYIKHMADDLGEKLENTRAKGVIRVGYPPEEILKYADESQVDLIMLTTHGRSGIRFWNIGDVANKVIHAAKIPVWVVPSQLREEVIFDRIPKRPMVIPLNGSKLSESIIPHAINLAQQRGKRGGASELVLVYVDRINRQKVNYASMHGKEEERQFMTKYLEDKIKQIKEVGIEARSVILKGEPAEKINDFVNKYPSQLITMATHGFTGISRFVFSSVTEGVLHLVKKTPIFIIRSSE
jgi:nucleotide-binding universal stress UspA family protein